MQEHQIVVALSGKRVLSAEPEHASLDVRQSSCSLGLCQVAITLFVIFHACLCNEGPS